MSNLYSTEPAPNGKVIVDTTAGEIEIELWGKENPKAVRNFLQLAMEGYYDGIIFHRVVKGFIIQTGDPTGTGMGGESIYGEPFMDEIHSRLKFNRRGLIGMANNGKRHTNNSQWFITLDRADELNGKHTLFGRIQGPTYFNVLNIGNLDVDEEERPQVPPKIKGIRIIENPFDDIVPRITAAEKKAQQQARREAKAEMEKREKRAKAKKNTGLLSFGAAEEDDGSSVPLKKEMGRRDLVSGPSKRSRDQEQTSAAVTEDQATSSPESATRAPSLAPRKAVDLKSIRADHERQRAGNSMSKRADIERLQDDLRMLKKRTGQDSDSDSEDSETRRKRRRGPSALEQELAKYKKGRGRAAREKYNRKDRRDNDDDLLRDLGMFSQKVLTAATDEPGTLEMGDEGAVDDMEVDDDVGWLKHSLKFAHEVSDETRRAEDEYTVIDPRAKARELAEQERKEKESKRRRDP